MTRPVRVLIALVVTVIAFVVYIKVSNVPPERYMAPPTLYQRATAQTYARITSTNVEGFSGHLLSGPSLFDYINYTFQPKSRKVTLPDGTQQHMDYPEPYTGKVHVDSLDSGNYAVGKYVVVNYDPIDPKINGVQGTVGLWSTGAGYLNPYLWWYVGIFVIVVVLQEIMRIATRTNDFRA